MGVAPARGTEVAADRQGLRGRRPGLSRLVRPGRAACGDRPSAAREFVDHLLTGGARPATAVSRHLAVRRFSAWLTEEGEQGSDPLLGLKAPKLDKPVVEPLSDDQLRALLKACRGPEVRDKRDEAIVRLMFTTGARAGEVVALQTGDLSLRADPPTATIRRGKGGTGRVVPLAVETAATIDRYLRARKGPRLAGESALWVGDRGKGFTYDALHKTLVGRAQAAGIAGFHPHLLRHTAAIAGSPEAARRAG